jgi:hypothetical protein
MRRSAFGVWRRTPNAELYQPTALKLHEAEFCGSFQDAFCPAVGQQRKTTGFKFV